MSKLIPYGRISWKLTSKHVRSTSTINNSKSEWSDEKSGNKNNTIFKISALFGIALGSWGLYKVIDKKYFIIEAKDKINKKDANEYGAFIPNLPYYTLDDVAKHNEKATKVWVTYKQGVYDITSFIDKHPGGDVIMLAAGGALDPFWSLYAVHQEPGILRMLEKMRIGNITEEEAKESMDNMKDPYHAEPHRHPALKVVSQKPFNAETPPSILADNFYTPNELFFTRNHLPVPDIDIKTYELEVEIEGSKKQKVFNLNDIKKLPKHTVTATIMCAGNRRSEMMKVKTVKGLSWEHSAIGNATWTGPKLRDVLIASGFKDDDKNKFKHVQFEGYDTDSTSHPYGASIPLWKALDEHGDVILAYEMNGQPLSRDHGFPVRVIVPGTVAARNVKWLSKIIVSKDESDSHWQQNDYKGFSPNTNWNNVDFNKAPAIQELPVISAICIPKPNSNVDIIDGHITVKGYAWSGGGHKVIRVDLTLNEGDTWHTATFDKEDPTEPPSHWAWTLWTAKIPVPPNTNKMEIWVKAVDSSYNTQPENFKNIWNLRGVLNNAYHRVPITTR